MKRYIHAIETAVPLYVYHQDYAMTCMKRWVSDKVLQRMVHAIYRQSGIERRYSVLPDFQPGMEAEYFRENADGTLQEPSTGDRNHVYEQSYPALAREAVTKVFNNTPWLKPSDITHVITVSCTGFCNPGPDLFITREFGLSENVERYHIGFMGCYAAFPALRMADQFCRARPGSVVLILCIELCSLHLQIKPTADSLLANALFADGAAAVLVSDRDPSPGFSGFALEHFGTKLISDGEKDMAWTIGNRGFDMVLSSYVPRILGLHARRILSGFVEDAGVSWPDVAGWAVHPGGKAILTALEQEMGWTPERELALSYRILREYGNMSSVTVLFVLKAMMEEGEFKHSDRIGALAFGPGLTVEFGMLRMIKQNRIASIAASMESVA